MQFIVLCIYFVGSYLVRRESPVLHFPDRASDGSAERRIISFRSFPLPTTSSPAALIAERTRAAVPATRGVDVDVPLSRAYFPPGAVLSMLSPGAAMSTDLAPKLEKLERASPEFDDATDKIMSLLRLAGNSCCSSVFLPDTIG